MTWDTPARRMRLIVGLDLSERSEPAFARAVRFALERNAELCVLHAISADLPDKVANSHAQYATTLVQDHTTRANGSGLHDVTQIIARGREYEAIVEQAEKLRADLIVLGTHQRRGIGADLLGTTIDRVLRLSGRPVLLVQKPNLQRYKRIIVAVDFSEASRRALSLTLELFPEAEILVVNTWGWRRKPMKIAAADSPEQSEAHRLALKGLVRELEDLATPRVDGEPRRIVELVETGMPEVVIPELAAERLVDLVVVGTHARAGVTRFLIGSVAEEIMLRVEADVLAVPPPSPVHVPEKSGQETLVVA
jgi:universal stress protein E